MSQSPWSTVITSAPDVGADDPRDVGQRLAEVGCPGRRVGGRAGGQVAGRRRRSRAPAIASRTARPIGGVALPRVLERARRRRPSSSRRRRPRRWSTRPTTNAGFGAEERGRAPGCPSRCPAAARRPGSSPSSRLSQPLRARRARGRRPRSPPSRRSASGWAPAGRWRARRRACRRSTSGAAARAPGAGRTCASGASSAVWRYADARARGVVGGVAVRHHQREPVGGAAQRQQHQHRAGRRGQAGRGAAGDGVRPRAGAGEPGPRAIAPPARAAAEQGAAAERRRASS